MSGEPPANASHGPPAVSVALEQALACHRSPALLAAALARPLPAGIDVLLRIVSGDSRLVGECARSSGERPETVVEAAAFYLQQLLFLPNADSYRVLGVRRDAGSTQIKEHHRWLVRWLHPDRNRDGWENAYAERVNRAWQDLRTASRRQDYDAQLAGDDAGAPASAWSVPAFRSLVLHDVDDTEPDRQGSWLPQVVVTGLAVVAAMILLAMWYGRPGPVTSRPGRPDLSLASTPSEPSAELAEELPDSSPPPAAEPIPVAERPAAPLPEAATAVAPPPGLPAPVAADAPTPGPPAAVAAVPIQAAAVIPARVRPDPPAPQPAPPPAQAVEQRTLTAAVAPDRRSRAQPVAGAAADADAAKPAEAVPPMPMPMPMPSVVQEAEALALLSQFTDAYSQGDIDWLMSLFTADARNNRGARDAIASDYRELFRSSGRRSLRIEFRSWLGRRDSATVLAQFKASIRRHDKWLAERSDGNIRFELMRENGVLKIQRMLHEVD